MSCPEGCRGYGCPFVAARVLLRQVRPVTARRSGRQAQVVALSPQQPSRHDHDAHDFVILICPVVFCSDMALRPNAIKALFGEARGAG